MAAAWFVLHQAQAAAAPVRTGTEGISMSLISRVHGARQSFGMHRGTTAVAQWLAHAELARDMLIPLMQSLSAAAAATWSTVQNGLPESTLCSGTLLAVCWVLKRGGPCAGAQL